MNRVHAKLEELLAFDLAERNRITTVPLTHDDTEGFTIHWRDNDDGTDHGDDTATVSSEDYLEAEDTDEIEDDESVNDSATVSEYSAKQYYEPTERPRLNELARQVLTEQPGITMKTLALEVVSNYGRTRTSTKQRDHLMDIIKGWVGVSGPFNGQLVIWPSADSVRDEIPWRGVDAFDGERKWNEIAYPEALGLAREALDRAPSEPILYICDAFNLQRRYDTTLAEFQTWVNDIIAKNDKE